jgi:glycosyltransferase involved in cell wall biosynthesis
MAFKNNQLISVICVVFNGERTISQTLESLINQSYKYVEIIIVDGQSTDRTLEIIELYKDYIDILITGKDAGIYDAMNKGISAASGNWLYFIGCDDVLINSSVFSDFINKTEPNIDNLLYYGNVILEPSGMKYGGEFDLIRIIKENICHQAVFYHRSIFQNIGQFNLKYIMLADWDLNIRCFGNINIKCQYIDLVVAKYNELGQSSSVGDKKFNNEFIKIIYQNLPFRYSIFYLFYKLQRRFKI